MKKLGVVMDSIQAINIKKDSTIAMLWAAKARGWQLYYFEQKDLAIENGQAIGDAKHIAVHQDDQQWFTILGVERIALAELDMILMRKDPPFDREYIYTTYILENAQRDGVLVVNNPQALRDANEKIFATWFKDCCPPTLVTRNMTMLKAFQQTHGDIICKPLDAMGGSAIFRLQAGDPNASVVFETLTARETGFMMAQKFIPAITAGDKRIIMINGTPVPYALARIPQVGDWRGNLAAGAKGVAQPLSPRDKWICEQVGPVLKSKGLYFVGLDVIGDYLTEINVTSPTCIRELDEQCNLNIADQLLATLEALMKARH